MVSYRKCSTVDEGGWRGCGRRCNHEWRIQERKILLQWLLCFAAPRLAKVAASRFLRLHLATLEEVEDVPDDPESEPEPVLELEPELVVAADDAVLFVAVAAEVVEPDAPVADEPIAEPVAVTVWPFSSIPDGACPPSSVD